MSVYIRLMLGALSSTPPISTVPDRIGPTKKCADVQVTLTSKLNLPGNLLERKMPPSPGALD